MDSRALQAGVGASLTAADYRGMTADQVRQTQQWYAAVWHDGSGYRRYERSTASA